MFRTNRALIALFSASAACMLPACVVSDDLSDVSTDEDASDQIVSADQALVRVGGDRFWPGGNFRYCFSLNSANTLPAAWEATVRSAIAKMALSLPVTFTEIDCTLTGNPGTDPTSYILFIRATGGSGANSSETGFDGGVEYIRFFDAPDERTATHEILHSLGMHHEQARSDRDTYVNVNGSCIDDDHSHDYDKAEDAYTSGVYDYKSIMHYQTGLWCDSSAPSWCNVPTTGGGSFCATVTKKDGSPILTNFVMSREDINSIYYMYSTPFSTPSSDDYAGHTVATGDFDGDGYADVAVGLPGRTVGGVADAGEVRVYKGTSRGLYRWQTVTQSTANWGTVAGDGFGRALAAADMDNDGRDELIVGAPYHDVDGVVVDAGAVAVLRPNNVGKLQAWRTYTQRTLNAGVVTAGARFGTAVAAGRIARTFTSGSSGPTDSALTLAVGAPSDNPNGAVFLYSETNPPSGSSVRRVQKLTGLVASGHFGTTVAIGSLTTNNTGDLVVAAPFANSRGQIDVFDGAAPVAASNTTAPIVTHFESIVAPDADTIGFGYSLAIGNFRGSSANDIAIGAPWAQNLKGAVYVYEYENLFADPNLFHRKQTLVQNSTPESGDVFGTTLAAANIIQSTPQDELIVGAPGEDSHAGAVSVFRGGTTLQAFQFVQQSDIPGQTNQANTRFGDSLAARSINGLGDSGVTSDDFDAVQGQGIPDVVVGSPLASRFSVFWGNTTLGLQGHKRY
ncbi:M12 family metallopeptidase [Sorangium sp. So ce834]|uniref:M12 family metallopeptidase n=1 Tax=Sorangium sp. So ce834 TaxID=3133321 RepID=UPI003F5F7667